MVKYSCGICEKNYDSIEDAKKCEEKGLIGPDIEPGLLLSPKNVEAGFKIFYKELPSEGHERVYEFEEFLVWNSLVCSVQHYEQTASKFAEGLKKFNVATEKEIEKINRLIKEKFRGTGLIKASMEINNVEKIHNNLELKVAEAE